MAQPVRKDKGFYACFPEEGDIVFTKVSRISGEFSGRDTQVLPYFSSHGLNLLLIVGLNRDIGSNDDL